MGSSREMKTRPLTRTQAATENGLKASIELLEVIQAMSREVNRLIDSVDALEAKFTAIAGVTGPTGGATVDSQSRTAINAIIAAAT